MTSSLAPSAFQIQYWDNNVSDWVTCNNGDVSENKKVWYQLLLGTPVTTTKIRINFPTTVAGYWARVIEVEAWGNK